MDETDKLIVEIFRLALVYCRSLIAQGWQIHYRVSPSEFAAIQKAFAKDNLSFRDRIMSIELVITNDLSLLEHRAYATPKINT